MTREVSVGGRRWLVGVVVPGNTDLVGPLGLLLAALALAGLVQLAISLARRREEALEASRRRLRADARRSEAMQTMAAALLDAHDVDAVVEAMVRCAREATGAVSVTLGLLDEEGSALEIVPVRDGGGASEDDHRRSQDDHGAREPSAGRRPRDRAGGHEWDQRLHGGNGITRMAPPPSYP